MLAANPWPTIRDPNPRTNALSNNYQSAYIARRFPRISYRKGVCNRGDLKFMLMCMHNIINLATKHRRKVTGSLQSFGDFCPSVPTLLC